MVPIKINIETGLIFPNCKKASLVVCILSTHAITIARTADMVTSGQRQIHKATLFFFSAKQVNK